MVDARRKVKRNRQGIFTAEERREADLLDARRRRFERRVDEPVEKPTAAALAGPEEWLEMVHGWWEAEEKRRAGKG